MGRTPKPALWPDQWTHPYSHPTRETGLPFCSLREQASKGACCLLSASSCYSRGSNKVNVKVKSCPTLWDPMDCSPPGSSILGIFQARVQSWSGLPFPSPGDLPDPGIKPGSAALQSDTLPSEPPGKHSKPLPEFLVWSLDNFCGLGTAKNRG